MTVAEWHGSKLYRTCPDCRKLVQLNKTLFGSLHVCVTRCEKRGRHSKFLSHKRVGAFWKRRSEYRCMDCDQVVRDVPADYPVELVAG